MAREIETGEIVALKKIRMDNEKEGVCHLVTLTTIFIFLPFINLLANINFSSGNEFHSPMLCCCSLRIVKAFMNKLYAEILAWH